MFARRLLLLTFLESLGCICVERGIFFYSQDRLHFSNTLNLWLALAFGLAYIVGAAVSHPLCRRWHEKQLVVAAIAAQFLCHLLLVAWPTAATVFVALIALAALNACKWSIVESFVGAGYSPADTARVIGRFNISWASACPVALLLAGPLIQHFWQGLFLLPAALNLVALVLLIPLPRRPVRMRIDHPDRPAPEQLPRLRRLLFSSRWLMLYSYAAMYVLAPLMPDIFRRLGFKVEYSTAMSGLLDVVRLASFTLLNFTIFWHNRTWPLVGCFVCLPVGFVLAISGYSTGIVLGGEVVFGLAAGMVYYSALYCAMVVKNASVDAGGVHESLIGMGFAIGPGAGVLGSFLTPLARQSALPGMLGMPPEIVAVLAGLSPLFVVCTAGAAWTLWHRKPADA